MHPASTSDLKTETARVNGAKSTGPVTAEGKAVSSQNALKHGLCAQQVVLPGEDPAAYERLKADYARRFRPVGPAEQELVETIANSSWRLKRIMRIEMALMTDDAVDSLKTLGLLIRYEAQLNRTFDQSIKRLKELQENRPSEPSLSPDPIALSPALRNEPKPAPFAPVRPEKTNPALRL